MSGEVLCRLLMPLCPCRSPHRVPVTRWLGDDLRFYERMAYACAAVAFGGFVPTYWAPVAAGTFTGAPVLMSDA
jgi:hypothetical protein